MSCAAVYSQPLVLAQPSHYFATLVYRQHVYVMNRPEKYTIKPERKEIAAVSIDLTRHDDFQGPRKLEVGCIYGVFSTGIHSDVASLKLQPVALYQSFLRYTPWYIILDGTHVAVRLFFLVSCISCVEMMQRFHVPPFLSESQCGHFCTLRIFDIKKIPFSSGRP